MLQAVVLRAARRVRHKWETVRAAEAATVGVAVAAAHAKHARCTPRHARVVATRPRSHSSLVATSPFIAAIATRPNPSHPVAAATAVVAPMIVVASAAHAGNLL